MKSNKEIEKIVTGFDVKPRSEMQSNVLDKALKVHRSRKQQNISINNKWRLIMENRITKYAAVFVFAVLLAGIILNGISIDGSNVAWADVIDHLQSIQTMKYVSIIERQEPDKDTFLIEKKCNVYVKNPGLSRIEILNNNTVSDVFITKLIGQDIIRITYKLDGQKVYQRSVYSSETTKANVENPVTKIWEYIESITSDRANIEEDEKINGIKTTVFSASLDKIDSKIPFTGQLRIWVDRKTTIPVRVQANFTDELEIPRRITFEDIQWDTVLPDSLFQAPDGWQTQENIIQQKTFQLGNKKLKKGVTITIGPKDGQPVMTEKDIKSISAIRVVESASQDSVRKDIQLTIVPEESASQRIKEYTTAHVGQRVLMDFNGQFQYEPKIMQPLSGEIIMVILPSAQMTLEEFQDRFLE